MSYHRLERSYRASTNNTEQASWANANGQCEVFAKCDRTLELPPNTERKRLGRREGGEKSKQKCKIKLLFSETKTVKQNQKFSFHSLGRFAVEGWESVGRFRKAGVRRREAGSWNFPAGKYPWRGRRREKNARKFFGFCTRESASMSEAHWFASPRNRGCTERFRATMHSTRAKWVRAKANTHRSTERPLWRFLI